MTMCIDRRSLLRSVTTGVVGLAGCTVFTDQSNLQSPRLVDLTATNLDDEPHTFHVRIELQDDTVYRATKHVKAADRYDVRGAVFTGYPTQSNPYVLFGWMDNRSPAKAQTLDFAEYNSKCLGINMEFGVYGTDAGNPSLAIYKTTNCAIDQ